MGAPQRALTPKKAGRKASGKRKTGEFFSGEFFPLPPQGPKNDEDRAQEVFLGWDFGMFVAIGFIVLWCMFWCARPHSSAARSPEALYAGANSIEHEL